jgi:NAD(P)-dependent dehydrogenase (short-subunit alcohol dehydrogenase family)
MKIHAVELDITSDLSIDTAVEHITQTFTKLDILVNNAGIADITTPGEVVFREACNRVLVTNVTCLV